MPYAPNWVPGSNVNARQHATFDIELLLKDAGTHTATGVGQVAGVDRVLDIGTGRVEGNLMLDITALDTTSNDELYTLLLQGSTTSDFSAGIADLATKVIGANAVIDEDASTGPGRLVIPFTNQVGGKVYPFVRVRHVIAGTTPSIAYSAWLAKDPF